MDEFIEFSCLNDKCQKVAVRLTVPVAFLDGEKKAKPEHRDKRFEKFFVSPNGHLYCSRECYIEMLKEI